jgi:hypothetical protein
MQNLQFNSVCVRVSAYVCGSACLLVCLQTPRGNWVGQKGNLAALSDIF